MRRPPIDPVTPLYPRQTHDRPLAVSIGVALAIKAIALAVLYVAFFVPPATMAPLPSAVFGTALAAGRNG